MIVRVARVGRELGTARSTRYRALRGAVPSPACITLMSRRRGSSAYGDVECAREPQSRTSRLRWPPRGAPPRRDAAAPPPPARRDDPRLHAPFRPRRATSRSPRPLTQRTRGRACENEAAARSRAAHPGSSSTCAPRRRRGRRAFSIGTSGRSTSFATTQPLGRDPSFVSEPRGDAGASPRRYRRAVFPPPLGHVPAAPQLKPPRGRLPETRPQRLPRRPRAVPRGLPWLHVAAQRRPAAPTSGCRVQKHRCDAGTEVTASQSWAIESLAARLLPEIMPVTPDDLAALEERLLAKLQQPSRVEEIDLPAAVYSRVMYLKPLCSSTSARRCWFRRSRRESWVIFLRLNTLCSRSCFTALFGLVFGALDSDAAGRRAIKLMRAWWIPQIFIVPYMYWTSDMHEDAVLLFVGFAISSIYWPWLLNAVRELSA